MIINGFSLLQACPIKDMESTKIHGPITSHGLGEAGYDIRIKQEVRFSAGAFGDRSVLVHDQSTSQLMSGSFALASAIEEFQMPNDLVGVVHDKSTWARKGVSVFNTVIEPGWKGFLTLEIVFHSHEDVIIPAGSGIAQVVFTHTSDNAYYNGKYQHQANRPVPAVHSHLSSLCAICHEPQFFSNSGICCINGHSGAPSYEPDSDL